MQSIAEQMSLLYCYIYVFFIVLDIRLIKKRLYATCESLSTSEAEESVFMINVLEHRFIYSRCFFYVLL